MHFEKNRPLANLTTLKIGGPATLYAEPTCTEEWRNYLLYATRSAIPLLILGRGSNLLIDDCGWDGLVLLAKNHSLVHRVLDEGERLEIIAEAAVPFARLGHLASKLGFSGLEFSTGIPGSVGGALFMNAGAGQGCVADTLVEATYLFPDGSLQTLNKDHLAFGYRFSSLQKEGGVILQARFLLKKDSLAEQRQRQLLAYRLRTQPYGAASAGSFFKNPPGNYAGRLIELSGFKGKRIGDAAISELHANFFINCGKATASDLLSLSKEVVNGVANQHGIFLEREVRLISQKGIP